MISQAVFRRVFHVRVYENTGTAFSFETDGRQYLATAKHILGGLNSIEAIKIRQDGAWQLVRATTVGCGAGEIDIVVLALNSLHPTAEDWTGSGRDCFVSQEVFFLGFPFGIGSQTLTEEDNVPLAFVKKACFSAIFRKESGAKMLYLDGTNNDGFSGAPVVAPIIGSPLGTCKVVGVVKGYRWGRCRVESDEGPTDYFVRENTGIIEAYSIEHAVEIARANPVGFPVPATHREANRH